MNMKVKDNNMNMKVKDNNMKQLNTRENISSCLI